ncbi:MAG: c-type cytochrome [Burkholderiaceae bacterium]|nr:c-type cytochrome [Burkholderiaceae bacterium]
MKFFSRALAALFAVLAGASQAAPPFEDSIAQRTLACTACHGPQGRAGPDGYYPRLAGKPAQYLYHQLLNFRDGRRHYDLMTRLVDPLSEGYLLEIARHFSSLDVPYPPPSSAPADPAALRLGEALALRGDPQRRLPACVQCHGPTLMGMLPATPGLLGLPRDYLSAQLGAWKTQQRRAHAPDCMARITRQLSLVELNAVATWLAVQPVPAHTRAAAAPTAPLPLECGSANRAGQ